MKKLLSLVLCLATKSFGASPIIIPLGTDLAAYLAAAKPNMAYQLAKGTWVSTGIVIKAAGLSLDLNGSQISLNPVVGGTTGVAIYAPHVTIFNGTIVKAFVAFRSFGDSTYLHDLVSNDANDAANTGVHQFLLGDVGSTNAHINNCKVGLTDTVSVYWMADNMLIENSTFAGSYGEYDLRQDVQPNGIIAKGAVLNALVSDNHINKYNKSDVGFRMGGGTVENSTVKFYMRVGQVPPAGTKVVPGQFIPNMVVKNVIFSDADHSPQLSIDQGVAITVENCTFYTNASTYSMSIDKYSSVSLINNIRKIMVPGITPHKFYGIVDATLSKVTEIGTVIK